MYEEREVNGSNFAQKSLFNQRSISAFRFNKVRAVRWRLVASSRQSFCGDTNHLKEVHVEIRPYKTQITISLFHQAIVEQLSVIHKFI